MDGRLAPRVSPRTGDALVVERSGDVERRLSGLRHVKDAPDDLGRIWGRLQFGSLLGSILDHHPVVAEGSPAGHPEASRCSFPHTPGDLLGQIFTVELVHAFDDGLKEPAGGGILGLLRDGYHANALTPQHGLEGDGVLPLSGESGELPDQNLPEGGVDLGSLVNHPAELWPIGDAPALGLVHVFADDRVAVLAGVFSERSQLCSHGQVHVLAVAGHPGVEGHRRVVV